MTCQRRTVKKVTRPKHSFFAFHDEDALTAKHEECLLVVLTVVTAVELSRFEHTQVEPELREPSIIRLRRASDAHPLIAQRRQFRHVDDEPPLAHRPKPCGRPLERRLPHSRLVGVSHCSLPTCHGKLARRRRRNRLRVGHGPTPRCRWGHLRSLWSIQLLSPCESRLSARSSVTIYACRSAARSRGPVLLVMRMRLSVHGSFQRAKPGWVLMAPW